MASSQRIGLHDELLAPNDLPQGKMAITQLDVRR